MSMLVVHRLKLAEFVIIPYKRPKGDSLHYASSPVEIISAKLIEREIYNRLGEDLLEDRDGIDPQSRHRLMLKADDEKKILTDASAIDIGSKRAAHGFTSNIVKFTPCVIQQRRLHKVTDIDPTLNIEVDYPMSFDESVKAFRLAFERAG